MVGLPVGSIRATELLETCGEMEVSLGKRVSGLCVFAGKKNKLRVCILVRVLGRFLGKTHFRVCILVKNPGHAPELPGFGMSLLLRSPGSRLIPSWDFKTFRTM